MSFDIQSRAVVVHYPDDVSEVNNGSAVPLLQAFLHTLSLHTDEGTWDRFIEDAGAVASFSFEPDSSSDLIFDHMFVPGDEEADGVQRAILFCNEEEEREALVDALATKLGFFREEILLFNPTQVTMNEFYSTTRDLVENTSNDDAVFFYYSSGRNKDEGFLSLADGAISEEEFRTLLLEDMPARAQVTCIIDSVAPVNVFELQITKGAKTQSYPKEHDNNKARADVRSANSRVTTKTTTTTNKHIGFRGTRIDLISCTPAGDMIPPRTGLGRAFLDVMPPPSFPQRMDLGLILMQLHMRLQTKLSKAGKDLVYPRWASSHRQDRHEIWTMKNIDRALLIGVTDAHYDPTKDLWDLRKYWELCNPDVPSENCRVLMASTDEADNGQYDGEPTKANIMKEIEFIASSAKSEECIFIFFSGPGETSMGQQVLLPIDHEEAGAFDSEEVLQLIEELTYDDVKAFGLVDSRPDGSESYLPHVAVGDGVQARMYSPATIFSLSGDSNLFGAFQAHASSVSTWGALMDDISAFYRHQHTDVCSPVLSSSRKINHKTPMRLMQGGDVGDRHAIFIGVDSGDGKTVEAIQKFQRYLEIQQGFLRGSQNVILLDDGKHEVPDRYQIVHTIHDLVEQTEPGDSIFLAYFGPGAVNLDWAEDEPNPETNPAIMVPMDSDEQLDEEKAIFNNDLARLLFRRLPEGALITCLFAYQDFDGRALQLPFKYYMEPSKVKEPATSSMSLASLMGTLKTKIEDSIASLATEVHHEGSLSLRRSSMNAVVSGTRQSSVAAATGPRRASVA